MRTARHRKNLEDESAPSGLRAEALPPLGAKRTIDKLPQLVKGPGEISSRFLSPTAIVAPKLGCE